MPNIINVPGQFKAMEYGVKLANMSDIADNVFGPFESKAAAHTALSALKKNTIGTTVGITTGENTVVEYWYQGGTTQNDLVLKKTEQAQADWNQSDDSAADYIKNKPTIPTVPTNISSFTNDAGYITNAAISGKADKSEMSVTSVGTDKATIQLKSGTSATVLTDHQDISTKANVSDVNTALAGKANTADVNAALNEKANITDMNTALAEKADSDDVYTKSETYSKTEINGHIDTPHQNFVTAEANSQTTSFADVLPQSGSTDTIYRVSNWDGSTNNGMGSYDVTKYSEYTWNGSASYIFLCVKSQIGEVFDISEYNNSARYADLDAALGADGANVPANVRKGGMSVKFVNTSGKYEQWRYMSTSIADAEFVVVTNWQGVDDEPTDGSNNLVKSGGVYGAVGVLNGSAAVQPQKLDLIDSFTDRKAILGSGNIIDTGSPCSISNAIDVTPYIGKRFVIIYGETTGAYGLGLAFYNSGVTFDKNTFIQGGHHTSQFDYTPIVPENAMSMIISCHTPKTSTIETYLDGEEATSPYSDIKDTVKLHDAILKNIGAKTTTVWGDDDSHNFKSGVKGLSTSSFFIKLEPHFYTKLKSGVAANSSKDFKFYHYDDSYGLVVPFHTETLVNDTDADAVIEKDIALDFSNEERLSFIASMSFGTATAQWPGMPFWNGSLESIMTAEQWDAATSYGTGNYNLGFSMEYIVASDYEDDSIIRTVRTSNFFKKKKYVAFGDSIMVVAGDNLSSPYIIPSLIGKYFDMATINRGASGSVPIASSNLSDANLAYVDADTMLVTISGGQNNWITSEDINSTDRKTSIGAINYYIDQIRSISPKCVIVLCPTYVPTTAFNGTCNADYKRIAENKGVGLAPTTDLSIINWEADRTPKVLRIDNVHPTEYGALRFAAVCIKYLEQMIL